MKNKKKLLGCIALLAFSALAAGVAGAGSNISAAEAADGTAKKNGFYMEEGASVRVDGKAGVRYSAYLSADKYAELIEAQQTAGKEVKIYAVVNRADTGATLGSTNAVQKEIQLPAPDENGGYTLLARVTYDELENAETVKKASAVELSARYYIVTDGNEQTAIAADENDNARSMRAVANAALSSGEVTAEEVKNYLGTVDNSKTKGKMFVADTQTIDLSGVMENDSSAAFDTAYFGAKKVGSVANKKVTLNTAFTAEIGDEISLTLMDSANNVLNASFVYGYTTISGTVQGASGTVTATGSNGATFAGEITDENSYTVDVLANDTYNLYFACGSGATATDGILNGVAVETDAVTEQNLAKTYAKVKAVKHGDGAGDTYGDWTRTANNEYSAKMLSDGDSYTLGTFAEAEDFYVSARIQGGKGKFVGAGVDIVGDDFGNSSANKNLQFFKIDNNYWVQLYSWGPGGWQGGINGGLMIEKDGGTADDFVFTLIRYEKAFHVFINGLYLKTWENTITDSGREIDLTKIGTVIPGMLLRGNHASGDVKFSEWEYTSDKSAVAEKLALGKISGTVEGADGTVTATLVENGVATNVKYSAAIKNKAYSLALTAGKTYNLYFNCGTTDGIIQGVTATKEGVTANLDKTYAKITGITNGDMDTSNLTTSGKWVRTANNEYTAYATADGNAYTLGSFGSAENFLVRANIKEAADMEVGIGMNISDSNKNLLFRKNPNSTWFQAYSWGPGGWQNGITVSSAIMTKNGYSTNDFYITLIRYNKEFTLYINDTFVKTWASPMEDSGRTIDLTKIGTVTPGLLIRGKSSHAAKFCDWSYFTAESDITEYIAAHQ